MGIEVARESAPPGWDELVREDAEATFFHTSHWARVLCSGLDGHEPCFFTLRDGGALVAGIPAVWTRRAGVAVLASMPFGTFGGPVTGSGAPPEATELLLDEFRRAARTPATGAAHLVDLAGRCEDGMRGFESVSEEAQVVRLRGEYDDLWNGFKPSARNKIRKAEKAGVTVRRASSVEDFLAYHEMLEECEARWGTPTSHGAEFFRALAGVPGDGVQMWLAEHEGSIIAGDLHFAQNATVMNWGNVSRDSARRLAPNNLLHAVGIEEGLREGRAVYNLGSSAGIEGVDAFKAAFGTERVEFHRYRAEKPWYRVARLLRSARRGDRS